MTLSPRGPGLHVPGFALLLAFNLLILAVSMTTGLKAWIAIAVAPILLMAVYLLRRAARSRTE